MGAVEWVDQPPFRARTRVFTDEVIAALMSRPGAWARVAEGHTNTSVLTQFRQRHEGFEVRSVKRDGRFDLYARYVGGEQ